MSETKGSRNRMNIGAGLAIGVGIGTAFGVAFDNVAMGVGLGIVFGVAVGALGLRTSDDGHEQGKGNP